MKLGATTIPLAGWVADPRRAERSRAHRLAAIRQLVEGYGLAAVELTLDLAAVYPQIFDAGFYADVADLQQALGFACTVHLPLLWLDLASLNEELRQASVGCVRRAVEVTQPLDVRTYTLHLWGMTTIQILALLEHPAQREAILGGVLAQAGRSLAEVCAFLEPRDVCVENLEAPPFEAVLPLVARAGVSICLDVGHLAWQGGDARAFLAQHGERVREVHLHDALRAGGAGQGRVRDHLALGHGEIDYRAFLDELARRDYDGAVILEVNRQEDLEESVAQVRAYL